MEGDPRHAARRKELMQSGLSLGLNNVAPSGNNVKSESGPRDGLPTLGKAPMNSRYTDGSHGRFGYNADFDLKMSNPLCRDMDGMAALDTSIGTNGRPHLDARVEGMREFPPMSPGDSRSGLPVPLIRQGSTIPHMQQRVNNSPGGQVLNYSHNKHLREGTPQGLSREASPGSSLGSLLTLVPTGNSGHVSMKPGLSNSLQTPLGDREQGVLPAVVGSAHHEALQQQQQQQQVLHQQAYHQQALLHHGFPLGMHPLGPHHQHFALKQAMFKGGLSPPQSSVSQQMAMSQFLVQRPPQQNQQMKFAPSERECTPTSRHASPFEWPSVTDQPSAIHHGTIMEQAYHFDRGAIQKETLDTTKLELIRGPSEETRKVLGLSQEPNDSGDWLGSGGGGGGGGGGGDKHLRGHSGGRSSREGMFADLNAEPPVSDGEEEAAAPRDCLAPPGGLPPLVQLEPSRTKPDETKQIILNIDPKQPTEGDEELKKASKPVIFQEKIEMEQISNGGFGSSEHHLGLPPAHGETAKNLKEGLVQVAQRLQKNAHAQFVLGLMHQRLGEHLKAVAAFEKAAEVLKQAEDKAGSKRFQFLEVVQNHISQCLLQKYVGHRGGPGKEVGQGEIEGVVGKLQELGDFESGQASIWNSLGLLLLQTGCVKSAIKVLTSLLEVVPAYLDALGNLGVAYLHSGDLERAARCFQAVLNKDKNHPGALVNYGALLLRQYGSTSAGAGAGGQQGASTKQSIAAILAQRCLQAALKNNTSAGHVWANLAAAYSVSRRMGLASQCLEQAVNLEPSRMSTRLAVAAHRVRDADQSEDSSEQLSWAAHEMASILRDGDPEIIPPSLAWAGLAVVNSAQHEAAAFDGGDVNVKEVKDRTIYTLQQAIVEDPEDGAQWHQLGVHTLCTLKFKQAQSYLKAAISRRRTCPFSWSNLGIALQLSEDPTSAEGVYKKALSFCPPEQSHTIYSNLGNLYRQQRRYSEAHTAYAKALEICPEYAPACNNLGLLYITEDRFDEALSSFDRALAADKDLDAAKSNRMKAAALAQIRKSSDCVQPNPTLTNSEPSQGPSSQVPEAVPAQGASPIPIPGVESTGKGLEKEP